MKAEFVGANTVHGPAKINRNFSVGLEPVNEYPTVIICNLLVKMSGTQGFEERSEPLLRVSLIMKTEGFTLICQSLVWNQT